MRFKTVNLYIICTPIGNLEDITLRALNILKKVNLLLVESKKNYLKLKNFYNLPNTIVWNYRESTHNKIIKKLFGFVKNYNNKTLNIGLISDAGMPLISDPGLKLLQDIKQKINNIKVIAIPGVSAVTTAFSIYSKATSTRFLFMGFWPRRLYKGIKILNILKEFLIKYKITVIFFVPKYDLINILKKLKNLSEDYKQYNINIMLGLAKELTKLNENVLEGNVDFILEAIKNDPKLLNGEFTLLVTLKK